MSGKKDKYGIHVLHFYSPQYSNVCPCVWGGVICVPETHS